VPRGSGVCAGRADSAVRQERQRARAVRSVLAQRYGNAIECVKSQRIGVVQSAYRCYVNSARQAESERQAVAFMKEREMKSARERLSRRQRYAAAGTRVHARIVFAPRGVEYVLFVVAAAPPSVYVHAAVPPAACPAPSAHLPRRENDGLCSREGVSFERCAAAYRGGEKERQSVKSAAIGATVVPLRVARRCRMLFLPNVSREAECCCLRFVEVLLPRLTR